MTDVIETYGLGTADDVGKNHNPILAGLTKGETYAYTTILEWRKCNPDAPLDRGLRKYNIDRATYYRARAKAEATTKEAMSFSEGDRIRPGVGLLKGVV